MRATAPEWPGAGLPRARPSFCGSASTYRELVSAMIPSGVLPTRAGVFRRARVSRNYPTVEIRIADVCLDACNTVLVTALCRGPVDTAARDWTARRPPPAVPTPLLRLAT